MANNNRFKLPSGIDAIKDLATWLFVAFLLPLVQIFFFKFSSKPSTLDESVYRIIFVAIASFLTSIFFVTNFWKQNRRFARTMLILSYIISLCLFISSLVYEMFDTKVFEIHIYEYGAIVAFALAVLVGFYSKYDEKLAKVKGIADGSRNITKGNIDEQEFDV